MAGSLARVGIGLCDGLGSRGQPDLERVRRRLEQSVPDVHVEVVRDLCRRPEALPGLAARSTAERLALAVCSDEAAAPEFQSWTRKAGLDPFAVELIDLARTARTAPPDATEVALLRLAAAVARLRAFAGSEPEQLRPRLYAQEERVTRRSLFTLPPITYEAVPSIDEELCLGERSCGLCVPACPVGAIEAAEGRLAVDKARCETCGLCVTACPVDAIGYPGSSLRQYKAEIETLLSASDRGLLFACRKAAPLHRARDGATPLGEGWLPIEVPCAGMVTSSWVLGSLAAGAPAVALLSCEADCRVGQAHALAGCTDYVRALLSLLGEDAPLERVKLLSGEPEELASGLASPVPAARPGTPVRGANGVELGGPGAVAQAVLALADRYGAARELSLAHEASPLGLVELREETCTACGTCVAVCPTGALAIEEGREASALSFDAARCLGCGRCASACPEAASETLTVRAATDLAALARGRVVLRRERTVLCHSCGRPVAPAAMLDRIRTLLEQAGESEELLGAVTELCADCRGLAVRLP